MEHARETRKYAKLNPISNDRDMRMQYAQAQATLAVYEELKALREAQETRQ